MPVVMSPLSIKVSRISSRSRDFSHCEARVIFGLGDAPCPCRPDDLLQPLQMRFRLGIGHMPLDRLHGRRA